MTRNAKPIGKKIKGLRQRQRADGTWRLWWEPSAPERAAGLAAVELDADRLGWSEQQCARLNRDAARVLRGDAPAQTGPGGRTIDALIADYRASRFYKSKSDATRRGYDGLLRIIGAKWGSHMAAEFSKPVINQWYETLLAKSGDYQALALVRMLSILFSHAETIGWRAEQSNPCLRLRAATPPPRSRSASWAEIDALLDAADSLGMPTMAAAIVLAAFQAQRQTDVIAARVDAFRWVDHNGARRLAWSLLRSKRDTRGDMPLHQLAQLRVTPLLDARRGANDPALLTDHATGLPYTGDLFRKRWAQIRAQAATGLPSVAGLQFRDLRRTFGVLARAGGAARADVGDVLGNSAAVDPQLNETYMPAQFSTAARAIDSIQPPKKGQH